MSPPAPLTFLGRAAGRSQAGCRRGHRLEPSAWHLSQSSLYKYLLWADKTEGPHGRCLS